MSCVNCSSAGADGSCKGCSQTEGDCRGAAADQSSLAPEPDPGEGDAEGEGGADGLTEGVGVVEGVARGDGAELYTTPAGISMELPISSACCAVCTAPQTAQEDEMQCDELLAVRPTHFRLQEEEKAAAKRTRSMLSLYILCSCDIRSLPVY